MRISTYQNLRVPNFSAHTLRKLLEEAGLDWRGALMKAGIDPDAVNHPGGIIPAKKELALQLQFVALTKDRVDLWVQVARSYTLGSFGIRGLAFLSAPTMEAWVELVVDGSDIGPGIFEITPLRTPEGILTGIESTHPGAPEELIPFSIYRDLCFYLQVFPWLYGGPFPFTHIDFPLPTISPEVSADIPCPVTCGSDTLRIWWEPEASTRQLPFGDAFQHTTWIKADTQILNTLKATGDWPSTVAKAIRDAPEFNRNLANVATTLRVSPRTLQRKLDLAGTSFAQLRDKALSDLAFDLLSTTDHSMSQISRMLGYTDPASFTIAFKRWTGMPPTAYREATPYRKNIAEND